MPFEWRAFLDLAGDLHKQASQAPNQEAFLRTALSRAYYAAFCYARNYARDWLGFRPRNDPDDHGHLREHLKRRRRRGDSDRLGRLRQWRNECDYFDDLTFGDLELAVKTALTEAAYVLTSLVPPKKP